MSNEQLPRLILTFRKGGRIKEQHIYDSGNPDTETQTVINSFRWLVDELPTTITIGKGFNGLLPWEIHAPNNPIANAISLPPNSPELAKIKLDTQTPIRVADVITDSEGTVRVYLESV